MESTMKTANLLPKASEQAGEAVRMNTMRTASPAFWRPTVLQVAFRNRN